MSPACHPERRATAGEAAGAQVEGSRESLLRHAVSGSSLENLFSPPTCFPSISEETVSVELPDAAFPREAFSGSFDSPLVAFAPADSLKMTDRNGLLQTETLPEFCGTGTLACA